MALGHVIAIGSRLSYDPNMTQPSALKTFLWFQNDLEEALAFYRETFKDVVVREENRMGEGAPLFTADFTIFGHEFIGMCIEGGPAFNSAISLSIQCDGQEETDRLWAAITKEGAEGQCGWCTDKWGVSWQITPMQMRDFLGHEDPEKAQKNWESLRSMGKIQLSDFVS
jgi:predicted 3-demethylubiquinone-9 3-methyltransferase (glyoxalase superfamily)